MGKRPHGRDVFELGTDAALCCLQRPVRLPQHCVRLPFITSYQTESNEPSPSCTVLGYAPSGTPMLTKSYEDF